MSETKIDRLTIRRSQPVQGQQVDVLMDWNGQFVGELRLPFGAWLKFKRLLEKGVEQDGRENYGLALKVNVKGIPQAEPELDPQPQIPNAVVKTKTPVPASDQDDYDPDIAAAEQAARADVIRSERKAQ